MLHIIMGGNKISKSSNISNFSKNLMTGTYKGKNDSDRIASFECI